MSPKMARKPISTSATTSVFLDVYLSQKANVTTGQIYQEVLRKERAGEYLGQCVQVILTSPTKSSPVCARRCPMTST